MIYYCENCNMWTRLHADTEIVHKNTDL